MFYSINPLVSRKENIIDCYDPLLFSTCVLCCVNNFFFSLHKESIQVHSEKYNNQTHIPVTFLPCKHFYQPLKLHESEGNIWKFYFLSQSYFYFFLTKNFKLNFIIVQLVNVMKNKFVGIKKNDP